MSFYLNDKVRAVFPDESIAKIKGGYSFAGLNLPSYIRDWLVKKFTTPNGELNKSAMLDFCDQHLPQKSSNIRGRLLQREVLDLLVRVDIEVDIANGVYRFGLPDLGIKTNEGIIAHTVIEDNPHLGDGECWGVAKLQYYKDEDENSGRGFIEMVHFAPFKPYTPNLDYYKTAREQFSTEEWIDFLIACMEYDPENSTFDSLSTKMMFLSRLLVFVEPNLNMIELAPKGTGKSYVFNNLSKYGWQISGGKVTRAKLFYNMASQTPGLVVNFDFLAMDEVKTISFDNPSELQGAFKNYLESGTFTVGKSKQVSDCGLILLGNIDLNDERRPVNPNYFEELPDLFHDTALIDRFHGFIEGWKLPRLTAGSYFEGYSLNLEYFSEIMNMMRRDLSYASVVKEMLDIPSNADARDTKAIQRLCSGYLKLLFPNVKSASDISPIDFDTYCFRPAMNKRQIIRHQLSIMDPEFKPDMPNIVVKGL